MAEDLEDVEFISLHKSIKNTSWSGKNLTEPCRTRAEELGHLKGQERVLLSQVGQESAGGKGRGKEAGWNPQIPGGIWREGRSPHPRKPLTGGSSVRTEGEPLSVWQENTATSVKDREMCVQGTDPCPAHPAWEGVLRCRQGPCAGTWGLEGRPRQRTLFLWYLSEKFQI